MVAIASALANSVVYYTSPAVLDSALVAAASYIHVRKLTSCATTRRASMKIVASIPTANLLAAVMTSALPLSTATEL